MSLFSTSYSQPTVLVVLILITAVSTMWFRLNDGRSRTVLVGVPRLEPPSSSSSIGGEYEEHTPRDTTSGSEHVVCIPSKRQTRRIKSADGSRANMDDDDGDDGYALLYDQITEAHAKVFGMDPSVIRRAQKISVLLMGQDVNKEKGTTDDALITPWQEAFASSSSSSFSSSSLDSATTTTTRRKKAPPPLQNIPVLYLGGSMVAGVQCVQGKKMFRQCAYPARVQDKLNHVFSPAARIHILNYARGGTSSKTMASSMSSIFEQFSDAAVIAAMSSSPTTSGEESPSSSPPSSSSPRGTNKTTDDMDDNEYAAPQEILFVSTENNNNNNVTTTPSPTTAASTVIPKIVICDFTINDMEEWHPSDPEDAGAMVEGLVFAIRAFAPRAAILFVVSPVRPNLWHLDDFIAHMKLALAYHNVAVLDLRLAARLSSWHVWSSAENPKVVEDVKREISVISGGKKKMMAMAPHMMDSYHPPWQVHEAIADMVAFGLRVLHQRACTGTPRRSPELLRRIAQTKNASKALFLYPKAKVYTRCVRPVTSISSFAPHLSGWTMNATTSDGGWIFTEDVAGKPGWISLTVGARITFSVTFGPVAPLALSIHYLRSYQNMGDVRVHCSGTKQKTPYILHGLWQKQISVTQTAFINAQTLANQAFDGGNFGFGVTPGSTVNLTLEFLGPVGSKFKLIAITAC